MSNAAAAYFVGHFKRFPRLHFFLLLCLYREIKGDDLEKETQTELKGKDGDGGRDKDGERNRTKR